MKPPIAPPISSPVPQYEVFCFSSVTPLVNSYATPAMTLAMNPALKSNEAPTRVELSKLVTFPFSVPDSELRFHVLVALAPTATFFQMSRTGRLG